VYEVRFHGRGGQGSVTAAKLLAHAAFLEGRHSQAFPFFGAERRGAPVMAFARIDDRPIRLRTQVHEPDCVVVLDPLLIKVMDVAKGLKPGGVVVVSSERAPGSLGLAGRVATVDALAIAREELGRPLVNAPILGAISRATGLVRLESLVKAVEEFFPPAVAAKNARAVERAYREARV
jgi:2-oxoacid:acceptor oxidoreductase gamma subunit (pyruvate/2-ketoisovalerate family)